MAESIKDFYNLGMRTLLLLLLLCFSPLAAQAEFGFQVGGHFGIGNMGNDSGSIRERSLGTFDVQFMPGYHFLGDFMGGLLLEYRLISQLTNQVEAGSDLSGNGFIWGLAAMYEPGPLKFLVSYDFRARHWFDEPETVYSGSGYRFLFGYKFLPGFAFDLQYSSTNYNYRRLGAAESEIADEDQPRHWNIGLGLSYTF